MAHGQPDLKHNHPMLIRQRHNRQLVTEQHSISVNIKQLNYFNIGVELDVQEHVMRDPS